MSASPDSESSHSHTLSGRLARFSAQPPGGPSKPSSFATSALLLDASRGGESRISELHLDAVDPIREPIRKSPDKSVEDLPLLPWFPRTDRFAEDYAIVCGPVDPARGRVAGVKHLPTSLPGEESAQVPGAHRSNHGPVEVCATSLNDLESDQVVPPASLGRPAKPSGDVQLRAPPSLPATTKVHQSRAGRSTRCRWSS